MKKLFILCTLLNAGFVFAAARSNSENALVRNVVNLSPDSVYVKIEDTFSGKALFPLNAELKQFDKDKNIYQLPSNSVITLPYEIPSLAVKFWASGIDEQREGDNRPIDDLSYKTEFRTHTFLLRDQSSSLILGSYTSSAGEINTLLGGSYAMHKEGILSEYGLSLMLYRLFGPLEPNKIALPSLQVIHFDTEHRSLQRTLLRLLD